MTLTVMSACQSPRESTDCVLGEFPLGMHGYLTPTIHTQGIQLLRDIQNLTSLLDLLDMFVQIVIFQELTPTLFKLVLWELIHLQCLPCNYFDSFHYLQSPCTQFDHNLLK